MSQPIPAPAADRERSAITALFQIVQDARALAPSDHVDAGAKRLLTVLAESGPVRPSALAAALRLDLSTVSRHATALQAAGLLHRSRDAGDGRAQVVDLTPAGHALVGRMADWRVQTLAPLLQRWDGRDRDRLFELLLRLSAELRSGPVGPLPESDHHREA